MFGGIEQQISDKTEAYRNNPQMLMQRYQQNQQLVDLLALQKMKSEKEAAARDIQLQMDQQPQTIAQQREQEVQQLTKGELTSQLSGVLQKKQTDQQRNMQQVANSGIAGAMPPNAMGMAEGGIVGYAAGDYVNGTQAKRGTPKTPSAEDLALVGISDSALFLEMDKDRQRTVLLAIYKAKNAAAGPGETLPERAARMQNAPKDPSGATGSWEEPTALTSVVETPVSMQEQDVTPTKLSTTPVDPAAVAVDPTIPPALAKPQPQGVASLVSNRTTPVLGAPAAVEGVDQEALRKIQGAMAVDRNPNLKRVEDERLQANMKDVNEAAYQRSLGRSQYNPEEQKGLAALATERRANEQRMLDPNKLGWEQMQGWLQGAAGGSNFGASMRGAGAGTSRVKEQQDKSRQELFDARNSEFQDLVNKSRDIRSAADSSADASEQSALGAQNVAMQSASQADTNATTTAVAQGKLSGDILLQDTEISNKAAIAATNNFAAAINLHNQLNSAESIANARDAVQVQTNLLTAEYNKLMRQDMNDTKLYGMRTGVDKALVAIQTAANKSLESDAAYTTLSMSLSSSSLTEEKRAAIQQQLIDIRTQALVGYRSSIESLNRLGESIDRKLGVDITSASDINDADFGDLTVE